MKVQINRSVTEWHRIGLQNRSHLFGVGVRIPPGLPNNKTPIWGFLLPEVLTCVLGRYMIRVTRCKVLFFQPTQGNDYGT